MTRTLARAALATVLAAAGCASIIGFPDYLSSSGSGGTGGAGTAGTGGVHPTASSGTTVSSSGGGTGGSAPACAAGAACYEGLDGTEGVGLCAGGTISCDGGVPHCDDVRPAVQRCPAPLADQNCDGISGCTGQLRWVNGGLPMVSTAIKAALDGAVAVVGTSTVKTGSAAVAAFDARGRACWAGPTTFGGSGVVSPVDVALAGYRHTPDGNLAQVSCAGGASLAASTVVAGSASGMVDFGQGAHAGAGGADAFVASLDPSGNVVWGMLFGSAHDDTAKGVAAEASGQIYVTGSFSGPASFMGCTATTGGSPAAPSAFVASVTPQGTCSWMKAWSGAAGTGVALLPDGKTLVLAGTYSGALDFGNGATLAAPVIAGSTFAVKLALADGTGMGTPVGYEAANVSDPRVAVDFAGNVFIGGNCTGVIAGGLSSCQTAANAKGYVAWIDTNFAARAARCWDAAVDVTSFGVAADTADNLIVGLASAGSITEQTPDAGFGPGGLAVAKLANPFTANLWAQPILDPTTVTGAGLAVDGMGDVVVTANPTTAVGIGGGTFPAGQAIVYELAP